MDTSCPTTCIYLSSHRVGYGYSGYVHFCTMHEEKLYVYLDRAHKCRACFGTTAPKAGAAPPTVPTLCLDMEEDN